MATALEFPFHSYKWNRFVFGIDGIKTNSQGKNLFKYFMSTPTLTCRSFDIAQTIIGKMKDISRAVPRDGIVRAT